MVRSNIVLRRAAMIAVAGMSVLAGACSFDNVPPPRVTVTDMSTIDCLSGTNGQYSCTSEVGLLVLQGRDPLTQVQVLVSSATVSRSLFGHVPINDLEAIYVVQVVNTESSCTASNSSRASIYALTVGTAAIREATVQKSLDVPTVCS